MKFKQGLANTAVAWALVGATLVAGCGAESALSGNRSPGGPLQGNTVHRGPLALIVEPDAGVEPVVRAVRAAKRSIRLEIYMFSTGKAAGQVLQALIERAHAGVDVRVILETQPYIPANPPQCLPAAFNPNTQAMRALAVGGVKVQPSSPHFKYTHEKGMVIDDDTAFIMSCNLTNSAFTSNRDYMVVDRTPADVAEIAAVFDADWRGEAYVPNAPSLVWSPTNSRQKVLGLIDSATRSLVIQSEFFSDPEAASHLKSRVQAGVDVTVMLSYQDASPCSQEDVNATERAQLAAAGVTKVAFCRNLTMHAKAIIADTQRAFVGSENLSANSLDNNRELGIVTQDAALVKSLREVADKDWKSAMSGAVPASRAVALDEPLEWLL